MKFYVFTLTVFFFVSCAAPKTETNNAAAENRKAKNREIAARNEVVELTKTAQKLEQLGRNFDTFRRVNNQKSASECAIASEDAQKQVKDFETRVLSLPDNYKNQLLPIVPDLNECVSCSKDAIENCKRARAAINQAIKDFFP